MKTVVKIRAPVLWFLETPQSHKTDLEIILIWYTFGLKYRYTFGVK